MNGCNMPSSVPETSSVLIRGSCDWVATTVRHSGSYRECSLWMLCTRQTPCTCGLRQDPSPGSRVPLVSRTAAPDSYFMCFSTIPLHRCMTHCFIHVSIVRRNLGKQPFLGTLQDNLIEMDILSASRHDGAYSDG